MKKLLTSILSVLFCVTLLACATACQKTNPEDDSQSNTSSVQEESSSNGTTSSSENASSSSTPRTSMPYTPATDKVLGTNTGAESTTIFFVGDSTVCTYAETADSTHVYKRYGYGSVFSNFVNGEKVTINNLALSGRSSKSFLAEANYKTLVDNIKAGDYLIIGFGHNDQKFEPQRYTNPMGPVTEEGSLKKTLYDNYVKLAIDKGATPILCTPIVRRSASGVYSGDKIHQTLSNAQYEGGDYTNAIIELGDEFGVTVVDLTTMTKDLLNGLADAESKKYYAWQQGGAVDNTHINQYGAFTVAGMICQELKKTDNSIKNYILDTLPTMTFEDMVPNV
ncbi:MAG: rhamnogalacturonan acetylesterase [Christensenellaceae bacterium]